MTLNNLVIKPMITDDLSATYSGFISYDDSLTRGSHTHTKSDITDFAHTHTKSEISDFAHNHTKADITDFAHTHTKSDITDFSHTHTKANITDFSHTHTKSEITDFSHTHDDRYYTESEVDAKVSELNAAIANISPLIAYPIGSVYFSVNDTNPSTILGGGTWELIGSKLAVRENVVGNGYGLAVAVSSSSVGVLGQYYTSDLQVNAKSASLGTTVGTNMGVGNYLGGYNQNNALGLATKAQLGSNPQYSGLIVDTETIYSWKRTA